MAVALQPIRMTTPPFVPLDFHRRTGQDMLDRARSTYVEMHRHRTTRHFSTDPVPRAAIELAIRTAGTAPSGAHQQPWTFVAVSDADLKGRMRAAAAGFFIAAVHQMGLVTLTHTPTPMAVLGEQLTRPANEKAFLVMPVGYPAVGARVPDLARKPLADIAVWR